MLGDTNSTVAGARAAGGEIPVAHVEAGLRSFDLSMPEERNRIEVDRLVGAPVLSGRALGADSSKSEGVGGRREVVGDVMADATRLFLPIARRLDPAGSRSAVLGADHSPRGERSAGAAAADRRRGQRRRGGMFVFPAHPRTRHVLEEHGIPLAANVRLVEPLGYLEMLALVAGAETVVTDSGGLQKEAYWLGVPCVTLRPNTEWVDTVAAGANRLAEPEELAAALADARFPAGRTRAVRRRPRRRAHRSRPVPLSAVPGRRTTTSPSSAPATSASRWPRPSPRQAAACCSSTCRPTSSRR